MSIENDFLNCIRKIEQSTKHIKDIRYKSPELFSIETIDGLVLVEEGIEKIQHMLSEEINAKETS